jgi:hypothetical protein
LANREQRSHYWSETTRVESHCKMNYAPPMDGVSGFHALQWNFHPRRAARLNNKHPSLPLGEGVAAIRTAAAGLIDCINQPENNGVWMQNSLPHIARSVELLFLPHTFAALFVTLIQSHAVWRRNWLLCGVWLFKPTKARGCWIALEIKWWRTACCAGNYRLINLCSSASLMILSLLASLHWIAEIPCE